MHAVNKIRLLAMILQWIIQSDKVTIQIKTPG